MKLWTANICTDEHKQIAFTIQTNATTAAKTATGIVFDEWGCIECKRRLKKYSIQSIRTPHVPTIDVKDEFCPECDKSMYKCCIIPHTSPIAKVCIHSGETLFDHDAFDGVSSSGENYRHWTVPIDESTRTTCVTISDAELCEYAIKRYVLNKDKMIQNLVGTFLEAGLDESFASLKLLSECMSESRYGDILRGSVSWLLKILTHIQTMTRPVFDAMNRHEKCALYIQFLCWARITGDCRGSVCTLVHQSKDNVVKLLSRGQTKESMIRLLTTQFSPINYLRPQSTATVTVKKINITSGYLGENWKNIIMTVEEMEQIENCITMVKSESEQTAISSAFATMRSKAINAENAKAKSIAFASRNRGNGGDSECLALAMDKIVTLTDVIQFVRQDGGRTPVWIKGSVREMYVAQTTINQSCLAVPHFWGFLTTYSIIDNWIKVSHMLPMYEYIDLHQIVFVRFENWNVADTQLKRNTIQNCCFPEFLIPKYMRECRIVFEQMNKITKINVPQGDAAYGCGFCATNAKGRLSNPVTIKIGTREFTIETM